VVEARGELDQEQGGTVMPITFIQGSAANGTGGTTTVSLAFTGAVTPGDLILVTSSNVSAGNSPTAQDSVNLTPYSLATIQSGAATSPIFWFQTPLGGSGFTITVTWPFSEFPSIAIAQFSAGVPGTWALDGAPSNNSGTSSTPTSGNITIGAGPDVAFSAISWSGSDTLSAGSGWTLGNQANFLGGTAYGSGFQYILNDVSGLVVPAAGFTGTISWGMAAAAFKFTPSSIPPTTATLSGSTTGTVGVPVTYTVTLDHPALSGGVSCPVTSSNGGDTVATSPIVIAQGSSTGTITITPSSVGARTITLGTTTPSLTIAGSPITLTAMAVPVTALYPIDPRQGTILPLGSN
jgi:hypothetical protein